MPIAVLLKLNDPHLGQALLALSVLWTAL
jgi:hypothetical protein